METLMEIEVEIETLGKGTVFTLDDTIWCVERAGRYGAWCHSVPPHATRYVCAGTLVRVNALPELTVTHDGCAQSSFLD